MQALRLRAVNEKNIILHTPPPPPLVALLALSSFGQILHDHEAEDRDSES